MLAAGAGLGFTACAIGTQQWSVLVGLGLSQNAGRYTLEGTDSGRRNVLSSGTWHTLLSLTWMRSSSVSSSPVMGCLPVFCAR